MENVLCQNQISILNFLHNREVADSSTAGTFIWDTTCFHWFTEPWVTDHLITMKTCCIPVWKSLSFGSPQPLYSGNFTITEYLNFNCMYHNSVAHLLLVFIFILYQFWNFISWKIFIFIRIFVGLYFDFIHISIIYKKYGISISFCGIILHNVQINYIFLIIEHGETKWVFIHS